MRDASEKPHADAHMCFVPAATFRMGSDRHYPEEAPAHVVTVGGFWMDRHTVTNRDFRRFVEATKLFQLAVSLGAVESLIEQPASMSHASYDATDRARHGISDSLVRLSVGLEAVQDLQDDLERAFAAL